MAQMKKPRVVAADNTAYAVVCTNQSALKLDDLTPNFTYDNGEIKDVQINEEAAKPDNAVEQSIRYVPTVHAICMDLDTARYVCLSLMIEHQGTETAFHVEEVILDNTSRPDYMCDALENLLDKVEVKELLKLDDKSVTPTSNHSPYEEDIFGDDGQD